MNSSSKDFGRSAEALAENWLRQKGYRILARNLKIGHGELDLVAQDRDTLIFVEVKGRRTDHFGGAPYAVTPHKQRQLIKLALAYLAQHKLSAIPCRFDVILVSGSENRSPQITHMENAFEVSRSDWQW
ncbi:MAG: YraN family protein [Nitrospirales bacterium]